ncbi:MAG: 3-phosphoglycerate dehydrogenase family protein [Cuneatibacter sp.]|nr:3-phosphoglycerate dehydrogenase family protein [Cuneatibacter sp.]
MELKKNIQLLNNIAAAGLEKLDPDRYETGTEFASPDAILVRSAAMHDMAFPESLVAIARCGAGVNNIPLDRCSAEGIVVFNTPGANANSVKELTLSALFLASRKIVQGANWIQTLKGSEGLSKTVEKGKSQFGGCEVAGKTLGVIGLGAIGGLVANAATHLGMNVIGCDPFLSVDAAWNLSHHIEKAASYEEIYRNADYITLHVPATSETKGMICADTIAMMKPGVKLINMARGDLIDPAAVKAALESGTISSYVTDFAADELLSVPGVIALPHLGASTAEAEENCAAMAAKQLDAFLTDGNIRNSVNFPNVEIPYQPGSIRFVILHENIPAMISSLTAAFGERQINIDTLTNKSRGGNAVTVVEADAPAPAEMKAQLEAIPGVLRVHLICHE